MSRLFAFDAFHLVEDLLAQPVLIVADNAAGSGWMSAEPHGRVRSPKKLAVVEGGESRRDRGEVTGKARAISAGRPGHV